jgi:hypothetical protein
MSMWVGKKIQEMPWQRQTAERTPLLRRPETFGQDLIAFTDESGNTGAHLFDPNQSEFWTGTIIAPPNFETIAAPVLAECLRAVDQQELHGSALGLSGIDKSEISWADYSRRRIRGSSSRKLTRYILLRQSLQTQCSTAGQTRQ